jgi:hypothetical protein
MRDSGLTCSFCNNNNVSSIIDNYSQLKAWQIIWAYSVTTMNRALIDIITYEGRKYQDVSDISAKYEMDRLAESLKPLEKKITRYKDPHIRMFKYKDTYITLFPEALKSEIINCLQKRAT